jgi:phage recombination protein Bet
VQTETNISVIRQKNNEITAPRAYGGKELDLIKKTVAKDTTTDEFNMFIEICKRQGLDPFRRQIYALVYNKDKADKRSVSFITGIDGYRAIAKRTGTFRPADQEPEIEYSEEAKCDDTNPKGIVKATIVVYQYAIDGWHPVVGTARWEEFAPIIAETEWVEIRDKNGNPVLQTEGQWKGRPKKAPRPTGNKYLNNANWLKMPHIMLAKCAEAQALRKGWPEEVGGLYVAEEMHKSQMEQTASEAVEIHQKEERLRAVNAVDSIPMILNSNGSMGMIPEGEIYDRVMSFVETLDTPEQIKNWMERNKIGLQQYWARCKGDALELKRNIENRIEKLTTHKTETV